MYGQHPLEIELCILNPLADVILKIFSTFLGTLNYIYVYSMFLKAVVASLIVCTVRVYRSYVTVPIVAHCEVIGN